MRLAMIAMLLVGVCALPARGQQNNSTATLPVGTVVAAEESVTPSLEFVGRIEAINQVEIRARVTGYLEDVLFKEGEPVKQGAPLYRIEKGLFEATVKQAQGALERAKSAKVLTEIQLQRAAMPRVLPGDPAPPAKVQQAVAQRVETGTPAAPVAR